MIYKYKIPGGSVLVFHLHIYQLHVNLWLRVYSLVTRHDFLFLMDFFESKTEKSATEIRLFDVCCRSGFLKGIPGRYCLQ